MKRPLLAVLVIAAAFVPAHADEPKRFEAPYACGTDESARRLGVLAAPKDLRAMAPMQTGCGTSPAPGGAIWVVVTPKDLGFLKVHSNWSGFGDLCTFAVIEKAFFVACGTQDVEQFVSKPNVPITVGAFAPDPNPGLSVLHNLEVTVP